MVSSTKRTHNSFWRNFQTIGKKIAFKSFICWAEIMRAVRSFACQKLVAVSEWNTILFVFSYITVLLYRYIKTIIHLIVGG